MAPGPAGAGTTSPRLAGRQLEAVRARERASTERARAAEHRAHAHEHLAAAAQGDPGTRERAEVEGTLGEIAERTALAFDEYAHEHEELAAVAAGVGGNEAASARRRADAAHERAVAHEEDARALAADDEAATALHAALSEAALERARRREQEVLAEQARRGPDVGGRPPAGRNPGGPQTTVCPRRSGPAAGCTRPRARMHAERAVAAERRAAGDLAGAAAAERSAAVMEEQGRAEAFRVEAAERRAEVGEVRRAEATAEVSAADAARRQERRAEEERAEARIRARIERTRGRRDGLRRYRPGPGRISAFPGIGEPTPLPEAALDDQIEAVEQAIAEHGPVERHELARTGGRPVLGTRGAERVPPSGPGRRRGPAHLADRVRAGRPRSDVGGAAGQPPTRRLIPARDFRSPAGPGTRAAPRWPCRSPRPHRAQSGTRGWAPGRVWTGRSPSSSGRATPEGPE